VGFIGANGAGKTTTMRILATLDLPELGSVEICGHDAYENPYAVRNALGWMPDSYGSYEYMSVGEYLDFFARAFGLRGAAVARGSRRSWTSWSWGHWRSAANRLSKGESQRLCLGRTLLHDPQVLILDEPAAGLDPKARLEFKELVRLLAAEGKTFFISSHILSSWNRSATACSSSIRGASCTRAPRSASSNSGAGAAIVFVALAGAGEASSSGRRCSPACGSSSGKAAARAWSDGRHR